MSGDRHRLEPLKFRPGLEPGDPDGDRAWVEAYAAAAGLPVGAVLSAALAEYRERHTA